MSTDSEENKKKKNKLTLKEYLNILRWILGIYFKNFPYRTSALLFFRILYGFNQLIYAYLIARIIDTLINLANSGSAKVEDLYPYLGLLLVYYIVMGSLISTVVTHLQRSLRRLSSVTLDRVFYTHLDYLGIQNLEDPEINDTLQRSKEWLRSTYEVLDESVTFITSLVRFLSASLTIVVFFPLMIPVLIIFASIKFIPDRHFASKDFRWQTENSAGRRKASWSSSFLQDPKDLHEIKLIGGFKYFDKKYTDFYDWYLNGLLKIFKQRDTADFLLSSIDSVISVIAYGFIFAGAIAGSVTIGIVTFQMRAIDIISNSFENVLRSVSWMNEFSLKMSDLIKIMSLEPAIKDGKKTLKSSKVPASIEFKNVSFKYPNTDKWIFRNLNLKIESGEKIAIVGHNGAGKTTLIKLIARFYAVTEGEILINGINLNNLKIADWYKQMGILFQEYNFYGHLTAGENISIGLPDEPVDMVKLKKAAENADADEFIEEYKNGYDQLMSEQFEGGIRPSSGQAQKIAIARFFYRNAPIAIFDEPTAAIDAVSEYKIFNRIYNFFKNKSVIIISHRFSTVRNANRIVVLDHGKVVEEGSHEELLKLKGTYAHSFNLQASGYQSADKVD